MYRDNNLLEVISRVASNNVENVFKEKKVNVER